MKRDGPERLADPYRSTWVDELLLRETNHRWSNDFQLVVGLLALEARRAANPEVRQALTDAMTRVAFLSRARSALSLGGQSSLAAALLQVCEALRPHAELRSITIALDADGEAPALAERQITTLALVANELATNAIKHAFAEGAAGHVRISTGRAVGPEVVLAVDDDGRPFAEAAVSGDSLGLGLAMRLMASIGGVLIPPPPGTKRFELRAPCGEGHERT